MIENIIYSGHHLIMWQRIGKGGIQNGESGEDIVAEHMADFQLLLMIGDDRAAVHFAAGTHHGQHTPHRDDRVVHILHPQIIFFPGIFFAVGRY